MKKWSMCNLYSITTNQAAIAALFRVVNRYVGNLAPMSGVFPEVTALICPHGGRYSNGPSRRRRDRGREGWGLWDDREWPRYPARRSNLRNQVRDNCPEAQCPKVQCPEVQCPHLN